MDLTYLTYPTRDEWLEARKTTIGASSLAHFIATGQLPTTPPDVPAVQSALRFGSIWEPMLVKQYADHLQLDIASKNTPVDDLKSGQLAWYDNSFYTDGRLHVSLDAAYRDHEGLLHTVEVKTGSKPSYAFLNHTQRDQYEAQAQIEARMLDTEHAEIIYAQRPHDWETLTPGQITKRIHDTLDIVTLTHVMSQTELETQASAYERATRPTGETGEGSRLLARLLETKSQYERLKDQLSAWLTEHPGERVAHDGHLARLSQSTRTTTDYKAYFSQHPTDLTPFQKTTTSSHLSIVKDR